MGEKEAVTANCSLNDVLGQVDINNFVSLIPALTDYFTLKADCFKAGQLVDYVDNWKLITSDQEILSMVQGIHINFQSRPFQKLPPSQSVKQSEMDVISTEIEKLLQKGVIITIGHEKGEFISPIFIRPKKDSSFRLILNLKQLNTHVKYQQFKMDTLRSAINMMRPNCYMASVDLIDAYYSVPLAYCDKKYLTLEWMGQFYKFTCFPNGLAFCPRKLKPVYATSRQSCHLSSSYIDDSYLQGDDFKDCVTNVIATIKLFDSLGFVIHPFKSVPVPSQRITYLGFVLDSIEMKIYLSQDKVQKLKDACDKILGCSNPSIREVSSLLGLMTASFPTVMYGPLHFRLNDMDKTSALRHAKGNFDMCMQLTDASLADIKWWRDSALSAYNVVQHGKPEITIFTDASSCGWGGMLGSTTSRGAWIPSEALHHINYLEMLAVHFALEVFHAHLEGKHVRVMIDNTTAVTTLTHMDTSHSLLCNNLVHLIWNWCIDLNIWLSTAHIPGKLNVLANKESRNTNMGTEWALNHRVYCDVIAKLGDKPTIDLFASRLNYKVKPFVAYQPDPKAFAIDAFTLSWESYLFYASPPFSLIALALQKIQEEATGLILVPKWPTQPWWPTLMRMVIQNPLELPRIKELLFQPSQQDLVHPLHPKLVLLLCHVSGRNSKVRDYQSRLQPWSWACGKTAQKSSMNPTIRDGSSTAIKGKWIPFQLL